MLIKDPYLHSAHKNNENTSLASNILPTPVPSPHLTGSYLASQPEEMRRRAASVSENNELQARVRVYENELKNMENAYRKQGEAARRLLGFNEVNREYH